MTLSNDKRRERYNNDEEYRNRILDNQRKKYLSDEKYREQKIKSSIKYVKEHNIDKKEYLKEYYIDNQEKLLSKSKFQYLNNRNEIYYWYSNGSMKCNECGKNNIEFLSIDHIDNNGADHRRDIGIGGGRLAQYIIKNNFPEEYQVLCNNCNYLKEYNRVHDKELSQLKHAIIVRKQRLNIRLQTLYWYSNGLMECECCKENDVRLLTIDHIDGGGKQHFIKDKIKNLYEHLYYNQYPEGYQVLCWNCNKSYGQYGYCPHHPVMPSIL